MSDAGRFVGRILGGVGGLASPSTVIVSGGFAAGAGVFAFGENIPYAEERPWAYAHSDVAPIPQSG